MSGSRVSAGERTELERQIAADVRALMSAANRLERLFAGRHDVSNNDLDALRRIIVAELEGAPLSSGELRKHLGVSAAAVTYLVDRMIDAGHLRRESDPADRRRVILRYSDHGLAVARGFFGPLRAHIHTAMSDLPDDDLRAAHRVLIAMFAAMESHDDELTSLQTDAEDATHT